MDRLPSVTLDIDHLPPAEKFAAWAATIPLYSAEQVDPRIVFDARAQAWLLGGLVVSRTVIPSVRLVRSREQAARDGLEYYIVVLSSAGHWSCRTAGEAHEIPEGTVYLLDSTTPFDLVTPGNEFIILNLARERVDGVGVPGHFHGHRIAGSAGQLFADYLEALCLSLGDLPASVAPALERATCDLLVSCLSASFPAGVVPAAQADALTRVRRHIDARLAEPLSPSSIARALGLSRTRLYTILAPVGGVQAYVLRRRLLHARRALENAADRRPIASIAYAHGFVSSAHFSRAFRDEFGTSPKALRAGRQGAAEVTGPADGAGVGRTLRAWRGNGGGRYGRGRTAPADTD